MHRDAGATHPASVTIVAVSKRKPAMRSPRHSMPVSSISVKATCKKPCEDERAPRNLRNHVALHRPHASEQDACDRGNGSSGCTPSTVRQIAARLSAQRPCFAPPLNVLIQVNQGERSRKKPAYPKVAVASLARSIRGLPRLKLRGLMTIPPAASTATVACWFERLAALRERLAAEGIEMDTLSMGMSHDFEIAIAAGSKCVRIGTAIFGPRRAASA